MTDCMCEAEVARVLGVLRRDPTHGAAVERNERLYGYVYRRALQDASMADAPRALVKGAYAAVRDWQPPEDMPDEDAPVRETIERLRAALLPEHDRLVRESGVLHRGLRAYTERAALDYLQAFEALRQRVRPDGRTLAAQVALAEQLFTCQDVDRRLFFGDTIPVAQLPEHARYRSGPLRDVVVRAQWIDQFIRRELDERGAAGLGFWRWSRSRTATLCDRTDEGAQPFLVRNVEVVRLRYPTACSAEASMLLTALSLVVAQRANQPAGLPGAGTEKLVEPAYTGELQALIDQLKETDEPLTLPDDYFARG